MPGVTVVGIVEIYREVAEAVARPHGVRVFVGYEEAVAELDGIDTVDVCVSTFLLKTYCLKAAADGFHVICEKPLAGNLEDAQAIIDA